MLKRIWSYFEVSYFQMVLQFYRCKKDIQWSNSLMSFHVLASFLFFIVFIYKLIPLFLEYTFNVKIIIVQSLCIISITPFYCLLHYFIFICIFLLNHYTSILIRSVNPLLLSLFLYICSSILGLESFGIFLNLSNFIWLLDLFTSSIWIYKLNILNTLFSKFSCLISWTSSIISWSSSSSLAHPINSSSSPPSRFKVIPAFLKWFTYDLWRYHVIIPRLSYLTYNVFLRYFYITIILF